MTILAVASATPEDRWEFVFLIAAVVLFFGARELYERRAGVGRHAAGESPSPTPPARASGGGSPSSQRVNPRDEPEDEPRETPSFEPPPLRGQVAEEARHRLRMLGLALTGQAPEPAEPAEEERFEEEEETVEEYAMRMAEKGLTIARTARGIQDHWAYSESHAKRIARAAKHEFLSKGSADGDRDD